MSSSCKKIMKGFLLAKRWEQFDTLTEIDHFTVLAKLLGLRMEARLPVTLF